ncbi:MAG: 4-hydroxythreonine-4-phosphate dehydrogenase PdxA [Planctomycetes bacterium]|nr:4-hydroxythreonine-4-phosphate dehydrogenase PdxA [Planctomycetota bacterium]
MSKPLIAITMGDPAGIGPETIVGAWEAPILHDDCRAIGCGDVAVMRRAVKLVGGLREVIEISSPEETVGHAKAIPCLPCCRDDAARVKPATIDARGGRAAHDALAAAAEFALSDRIDAIVTAPLNKVALHKAGYRYPGHTELLAELCNANNVAMMLYLAPCESLTGRIGLGVVHTTLHLALRDVFDQLTSDRIVTNARLASSFARTLLTEIGIDEPPRIGICALNPHAGEGGLFGDEERRIILPAVERCKADGLSVAGPLPCEGGEVDDLARSDVAPFEVSASSGVKRAAVLVNAGDALGVGEPLDVESPVAVIRYVNQDLHWAAH